MGGEWHLHVRTDRLLDQCGHEVPVLPPALCALHQHQTHRGQHQEIDCRYHGKPTTATATLNTNITIAIIAAIVCIIFLLKLLEYGLADRPWNWIK